MRRTVRILGTLLIVSGVLTLGWAALIWQWQDPFTAAYTTYQQHKLKTRYHKVYVSYRPKERRADEGPSLAAEKRLVRADARDYRSSLKEGSPLGRLKVPRLGLSIIAVNGTESGTLTKGPGRYAGDNPAGGFLPGEGELVYVAGHRTTYLAPFSHIDRLRIGDAVSFELPYATFHYVIYGHAIVAADDLARLVSHHREVLALQACHPRFFASHRYIAYARLVRVVPREGPPYAFAGSRLITAAAA
jgi:sortase A